MSELEQQLKEQIKKAREAQIEEQEKEQDNQIIPDNSENQESSVNQENEQVEEPEVEDTTSAQEEEELVDDLEEEEISEQDYKNLKPDAKKFYHMRKEAKEKDALIQEMRERLARLEGAEQERSKVSTDIKQGEVEEVPDKELEPEAWLEYQIKQRDKKIEQLEGNFNSYKQQSAFSEAEKVYQNLENEHIKTDPSYQDAKAYLVDKLKSELRTAYPTFSEQQLVENIKQQEYQLVSNLANAGWSENAIFNSIKAQAVDRGFKEIKKSVPKRDNEKLKRNMEKASSLNDAPADSNDFGFSESQLTRMKNEDFVAIANNPDKMKKMQEVIKKARLKAASF